MRPRPRTAGPSANQTAPPPDDDRYPQHDCCLYVDDGFSCYDEDCPTVDADFETLEKRFKLTRQETVDLFVGMNVEELPKGAVKLSSGTYIRSLCKKYLAKPLGEYPKYATPAASDLRKHYGDALELKEAGKAVDKELQSAYASLVGALIYVAPGTRALRLPSAKGAEGGVIE